MSSAQWRVGELDAKLLHVDPRASGDGHDHVEVSPHPAPEVMPARDAEAPEVFQPGAQAEQEGRPWELRSRGSTPTVPGGFQRRGPRGRRKIEAEEANEVAIQAQIVLGDEGNDQ